MPELPEVETIRRIIMPQLVGKTIQAVEVRHSQIVAYPQAEQFAKNLQNQTVADMSRRGKYLTIHMESGDRMTLHLRMTGQVLIVAQGEPLEKHTHLRLVLSGGVEFRYIDVRRFGRFWYLEGQQKDTVTGQEKLGPEPTDAALNVDYLKARLSRRKKPIKEVLHDQTIIAGIGNIYSDEILFAAGIYPNTRCDLLDDSDWEHLAAQIPEIILWAIDKNKMSPEEYLRGKGKEYRNTPYLRVYGRAGQPCVNCRTQLEKMVVAGRSSCYCPKCQRAK